jgi:hypothetical protein
MNDLSTMRDHIDDLMLELSKLRADRDRWEALATQLYNAAHETDHRIMRDACNAYEENE